MWKHITLLAIILSNFKLLLSLDYNYENLGPDAWPILFPQSCAGEKQSPIDILDFKAIYNPYLKPINFINYNQSITFNGTNKGHSIEFAPFNNTGALEINGSNFAETFTFLQLHFHWGENDYQGSEHLVNGMKFPLEMHLVHKSSSGKLAVVGFLFQLSENDNPDLDGIIEAVSNLTNISDSTQVVLQLDKILHLNNPGDYYRYIGSLTTPPCTEEVIWNVMEKRINISAKQMSAFHSTSISKNFRNPQRLYSRSVYSSREQRDQAPIDFICSSSNNFGKPSLITFIFIFVRTAIMYS